MNKTKFFIFSCLSLLFAACGNSSQSEENSDTLAVVQSFLYTNPDKSNSQSSGSSSYQTTTDNQYDRPEAKVNNNQSNRRLEQPAPLKDRSERILKKLQFVVSFNANTLCPNYVCWKLAKYRTRGKNYRSDEFTPDTSLPEKLQVVTRDYAGSRYDRGHMCPAADNKNDYDAMLESFQMSNICPQRHDLNAGDWNELEMLCRDWVYDYGDLYICCGPIFDTKNPKTIGKRDHGLWVSVPDRFFKVVLKMGKRPRAIGFIMPNEGTPHDIRTYAVSVDEIEKITGIDFYPSLSDDIENEVEAQCNPAAWNI